MQANAPPSQRTSCAQRRLSRRLDGLALYAGLCSGTPDTGLFEGNDGTSLLMEKAALRIECRGSEVRIVALSPNGESLLGAVARAFPDHVKQAGTASLDLRFDFSASLDADERLRAPAPLHALRPIIAAAHPHEPFAACMLGVIAFEYAGLGEEMSDYAEDPLGFPDYVFWVPESLILFEPGAPPRLICSAFPDEDPGRSARNRHDAAARLAQLLDRCEQVPGAAPTPAAPVEPQFTADLDDAAYAQVVLGLKEEIAAGEVYQIVPSRTFRGACPDPVAAFAALRALEPDTYRFFVQGEDWLLFGASPETSVRVRRREVEVRPIAGTRPRGANADEDGRLEAELRLDEKELAEHMMLVDLGRNDVARISIPGTRRVSRLATVERYARVMHLVSAVTGTLAPSLDAFDALAACLNVGTLTGAPKIRAMQLLRTAERTRRGPYGGAIGWINGAGAMDTAVVIRSALVRDQVAYVRAGAGVVHDSDPAAEAEETRRKASALLSILAGGSR
jgi:anthranilate synthase component 1